MANMADDLLDNYNPLYDVHLRQYFALPHMQKHLRHIGLMQDGPDTDNMARRRHHTMIDVVLRNREAQLIKLAEIQKKLDVAEKVETCRKIRNGITSPLSGRRGKASRSLSRGRFPNSRRSRRSSASTDEKEFIKKIETENDEAPTNPSYVYNRLSAAVLKYRYLHKLDDQTLAEYMNRLRRQLSRLERFREVSFGPHSIARHQGTQNVSWFFRRRNSQNSKERINNTGKTPILKQINDSHNSQSTFPLIKKQRRNSDSNRLPAIAVKKAKATTKSIPKLPPSNKLEPIQIQPDRSRSRKREHTVRPRKPNQEKKNDFSQILIVGESNICNNTGDILSQEANKLPSTVQTNTAMVNEAVTIGPTEVFAAQITEDAEKNALNEVSNKRIFLYDNHKLVSSQTDAYDQENLSLNDQRQSVEKKDTVAFIAEILPNEENKNEMERLNESKSELVGMNQTSDKNLSDDNLILPSQEVVPNEDVIDKLSDIQNQNVIRVQASEKTEIKTEECNIIQQQQNKEAFVEFDDTMAFLANDDGTQNKTYSEESISDLDLLNQNVQEMNKEENQEEFKNLPTIYPNIICSDNKNISLQNSNINLKEYDVIGEPTDIKGTSEETHMLSTSEDQKSETERDEPNLDAEFAEPFRNVFMTGTLEIKDANPKTDLGIRQGDELPSTQDSDLIIDTEIKDENLIPTEADDAVSISSQRTAIFVCETAKNTSDENNEDVARTKIREQDDLSFGNIDTLIVSTEDTNIIRNQNVSGEPNGFDIVDIVRNEGMIEGQEELRSLNEAFEPLEVLENTFASQSNLDALVDTGENKNLIDSAIIDLIPEKKEYMGQENILHEEKQISPASSNQIIQSVVSRTKDDEVSTEENILVGDVENISIVDPKNKILDDLQENIFVQGEKVEKPIIKLEASMHESNFMVFNRDLSTGSESLPNISNIQLSESNSIGSENLLEIIYCEKDLSDATPDRMDNNGNVQVERSITKSELQ